MSILKNVVVISPLLCFLGLGFLFSASGCRLEPNSVGLVEETTSYVEESLKDYRKRVTEFALRKYILGMTKSSIEGEIGVGELGTHGYYNYPMIYDALLVIKYENDRASEISINGSITYHHPH